MILKKRLNYEKYPACGVPCPVGVSCPECKNLKYSKFKKAFSVPNKQVESKRDV